jgi:hypothetical protein
MVEISRPVVPGCARCAVAHPDFGRSVNPISKKGDRLCPPNYYWHTQIFRPSDIPDQGRPGSYLVNKLEIEVSSDLVGDFEAFFSVSLSSFLACYN